MLIRPKRTLSSGPFLLTKFVKIVAERLHLQFLIERFCRQILHMNTNTNSAAPTLNQDWGGHLPMEPSTTWLTIEMENNSVNFYSVSCQRIVEGGQFELITLIITDHVSSIIAFPSIALASNGL